MVADDEYHVLKHLKKGYTMPKYEHVMIARQDLSNMQAEGLVEHFSKVLAENDGNVLDTEYWGLKTMAYKVNKNRNSRHAVDRPLGKSSYARPRARNGNQA